MKKVTVLQVVVALALGACGTAGGLRIRFDVSSSQAPHVSVGLDVAFPGHAPAPNEDGSR